MAEWERAERRVVSYIGPASCTAPELIRRLQEALSEWRELSGLPPDIAVMPHAVTVHGLITIRIEVDEPTPAQEEESRG